MTTYQAQPSSWEPNVAADVWLGAVSPVSLCWRGQRPFPAPYLLNSSELAPRSPRESPHDLAPLEVWGSPTWSLQPGTPHISSGASRGPKVQMSNLVLAFPSPPTLDPHRHLGFTPPLQFPRWDPWQVSSTECQHAAHLPRVLPGKYLPGQPRKAPWAFVTSDPQPPCTAPP